jgi:hypothetical protein
VPTSRSSSPATRMSSPSDSGSSASSGSPRRWSGSWPVGTTGEVSPESSARTPTADWSTFGPSAAASSTPWAGHCTDLPKVLRVLFRHDKRLHGDISRLIYDLVRDFTTEAAGKPTRLAAVVVFQSSGSFCRFHPHWHGLFLEGGFDHEGRFVHVPTVDLVKMSAYFRQRVIAFFLERKLLNERLARSMLEWTHSGFSVDASIHLPAGSSKTHEALAQYIPRPTAGRRPARGVRPPVSLQHLLLDEGGTIPWSIALPTPTISTPTRSSSPR